MSTIGEPIVDPTSAYFNHDEEDNTGSDSNEETDQDVETLTSAVPVTPVPPPKPNTNPVPNPSLDNGTSQPWSIVPGSSDESRRLFQRLWTDEEEVRILRGFLEFTSRRGII
jgi:hypothetical protein